MRDPFPRRELASFYCKIKTTGRRLTAEPACGYWLFRAAVADVRLTDVAGRRLIRV
jgi:hypothetical protein